MSCMRSFGRLERRKNDRLDSWFQYSDRDDLCNTQSFGMRISSRFRYALWAVVMIRLLCPVTLWNNQQLVHNITEVSRQMFQNTSGTKVDKVDSNAELGMENGQNAGVGDASNTDRTKNDYTGNVKIRMSIWDNRMNRK